MKIAKSLSAVLVLATGMMAQNAAPAAAPKAPVSFDKAAMDLAANPCQDFYQYTCGGWRAKNPIPPDQSRWGRFNELSEYNLNLLRNILEDVSKKKDRSPLEQKVGDFYAACMDESRVESLGTKPIDAELERISKLKDRKDLIAEFAHLYATGHGGSAFGFYISPDLHNASMNIAGVDQGGLTLPDRDYYLKDDAKMVETRLKYTEHLTSMFKLLGEPQAQAEADAKTVLALETEIAKGHMDRVARRDARNRDHKMTVAQLSELAPNIEFNKYFVATGVGTFNDLNVGNPDFFKNLNGLIASQPIETWKTYLRWRVLNSHANLLSKAFVEENFNFSGKYMSGAKELQPRWKRCTRITDQSLGEALGPLYVEKAFPPDAKARMLKLVDAIEKAMDADIKEIDWMGADTKKQAFVKLQSTQNKIGYPEKWKDYSSVTIKRDDLVGNYAAAQIFEIRRDLDKLGKPVDKLEWGMTPPTVNAYYSASQNNINFPAGILQPPFFSNSIDDAVNFGGIGVVIGHELTHGFDDSGRRFAGDGNLTDWWTAQDGKEFEQRASCIADEYSNFVAVKDDKSEVKLNGKLTLGENVADNGGMHLAYNALKQMMGADFEKPIDGFTPAQRFFIGFAQVWCENRTEQSSRQLALTDPHSPGKYRVIGTVSNSPEFQQAFGCKKGDAMVRENQCRVW